MALCIPREMSRFTTPPTPARRRVACRSQKTSPCVPAAETTSGTLGYQNCCANTCLSWPRTKSNGSCGKRGRTKSHTPGSGNTSVGSCGKKRCARMCLLRFRPAHPSPPSAPEPPTDRFGGKTPRAALQGAPHPSETNRPPRIPATHRFSGCQLAVACSTVVPAVLISLHIFREAQGCP